MTLNDMTVTRHISLDDEHIEKMRPYMEKHNNNFGAALREIINQTGKYSPRMNSSAMDISVFNWMLKEMEDVIVPDDVLDEVIDPRLITSMTKLEEHLKQRFRELEWDIDLALKYDSDTLPSDVLLEIKGPSPKIRFVACMVSRYLVKNSLEQAPLGILRVVNFNEWIKVELSRLNKNEAQNSVNVFFGGMGEAMKIIKSNPAFWKAIIHRHRLSNYNMVTVHRNYFEEVLANNIPRGEVCIENLAKKPVNEIPLKDMLSLLKEVYETSKIAERVEIDKNTISLYHNFRSEEAIGKLKKSLVSLLESNGHSYDASSVANIIVLTHRHEMGVKINEIVDNLKGSKNPIDQELIMFLTLLKEIKNNPDIPLSLTAFGRKIGATLMQEYENEKSIKNWNLENFQKALELIDSKLHRVSEFKVEGNSLLYTINICSPVADGNTFDKHVCNAMCVCQTIRETFKGALNYAFGSKAEFDVKKSVIQGDNFCEVMIRIP